MESTFAPIKDRIVEVTDVSHKVEQQIGRLEHNIHNQQSEISNSVAIGHQSQDSIKAVTESICAASESLKQAVTSCEDSKAPLREAQTQNQQLVEKQKSPQNRDRIEYTSRKSDRYLTNDPQYRRANQPLGTECRHCGRQSRRKWSRFCRRSR